MLFDCSFARKHDTRPPYRRPTVMRSLPDLTLIGELRLHTYKDQVHSRLCCGPSRC